MTLRETGKWLAHQAATLLVLPALTSYAIRSRILGRDRALEGSTQALAIVPGLAGEYMRRAFLRWTLASCSRTATISYGTLFSQSGARIGERAYIGPHCHIGWADIGSDTLIAAGVHIPSGPMTHGIEDPDVPIREQPGQLQMVSIGNGAWIGSAAIVLADVGAGAVVAAGAVVTRPLPPRAVAAGVPARVVRMRSGSAIGA